MHTKASIKRLKQTNFKLNSLLEITRAINENPTQQDLINRYESLLRKNLNIGKVLVFKFEDEWKCILCSGYSNISYEEINVERDLIPIDEIKFVSSSDNELLSRFDIVIPVYNKNVPVAFVIIGDIDEEGEGVSPTIKHLNFIQTLSNIIIVAIENIRLFNESLRQEAIKKEMELASKMQNMLIPDNSILPKNDKIFMTAFYLPHFDVGGDYYDYIELDKDEIGFCISDVSGKGISAAILMSNFQANLRALFTHEISLVALIEKLNERVLRSTNGEKFITLFIAKYNFKSKELEYVNAGHNHPLLYSVTSKKMQFLNKGSVGIGMLDEIPLIQKGTIHIEEPTKILCYTDGLVELMDEKGISFGTEDIESCIQNKETIENNISEIINKQGILNNNISVFDDISILGIEFY
ncbi:MAG: SpoIIE family protein phosphatase [Bacteroidales bacterium]|nr:SpoIIE family protein phosphatase [Bacteroidales bacterium]